MRSLSSALALCVATLPARADEPDAWPMFRGDPQMTGVARSPLPDKLELLWRRDLKEPIESTAAIVDGRVYVGCDDGRLYALDLANGAERWNYKASGAIKAAPTLLDGLALVGDDEGVLHAVDARDGAPRWTFASGAQIISSVNHADGRIFFGSYDGALYCLNPRDGALQWKYATGDRIHATPGLAGENVLVAGCDAYLHVVRAADGVAVRKVDLDAVCGAAAATAGSRVFLGTYGETVLGIDWRSGKVAWTFRDPDRQFPYMSCAAVRDGLVVVGGRDKRVHCLSAADGAQRWEFAAKGRVDSSPVLVGPRVFVGASDGVLYEFDLEDGKERWRFETGSEIVASPAVAGGRLVISTLDGAVCCFGAPSRDGG